MKSKRLSLAILSGDSVVCSMYEGEYTKEGLKRAILDAERGSKNYPGQATDTHIAVIAFPIKLDGKTRIIKKFELKHDCLDYDSSDYSEEYEPNYDYDTEYNIAYDDE